MELVTSVSSSSEWEKYRRELLKGFSRTGINYWKFKEVRNIISNIDWRFSEISQLKVKIRQDHKEELHQEYINRFYNEIHELVDVLNENFVLEILLGD